MTIHAEIRIPTSDLRADISFFTTTLKMRMDMIYPADDPQVAVFSGHGIRVRIETGASEAPVTLCILCEDPSTFAAGDVDLVAPNGTKVEIRPLHVPMVMPETQHSFVVRRLSDQAPWVIGRAGMH